MRTPLSIALAIIVLSLGARHAPAGSVYGDHCPPRPDTAPLDVIGCDLLVLFDSTDAATAELGPFSRSLNSANVHAGDRVFLAQSFCSFGHPKPAWRRLGRAKVALDHYVARLSSPEAQVIRAEIREPLVTQAAAIAAKVAALRVSAREVCAGMCPRCVRTLSQP